MIPIPLWLTPKLMKYGIFVAIFLVIFFFGFYTRGKLDAAKIQRMKTKVQTIESNYDLCLASLDRSEENYDVIKTTIERANAEVEALNAEYEANVIRLRAAGRAAISQLNALHDEAMSDMVVETDQLREAMATMSADEACNLAMREIVK